MSANPLRFDGRVAIVTGSGRGLGREYALLLGRLGAAVVVNSTKEATSQDTVKDITQAGGKAIAVVGSVTDQAVADSMVEAAVDTYGRIDIVINNAGYGDTALFKEVSAKKLWDMLNVHIGGAWNVTQAAWPHMEKQNYGRVLMSTSLMMLGTKGQTVYGTAKAALLGLTKSLALEGKEHNIHVNSLAPVGYTKLAADAIKDETIMNLMREYTPAAEVAPSVLWLCHEDSKVNGENFSAQGRVLAKIIMAETHGFRGSRDNEWDMETIRDHWDQVIDETEYDAITDIAITGAKMFQRAGAPSALSTDVISNAFQTD